MSTASDGRSDPPLSAIGSKNPLEKEGMAEAAIENARAFRLTAVGVLAVIVALIAVPWHMSPSSAQVVGILGICLSVMSTAAAMGFARYAVASYAAIAKGMLTVVKRSVAARDQMASGSSLSPDARDPFDDSMPPPDMAARWMALSSRAFGVRITTDELLRPLPLAGSVEANLRTAAHKLLRASNVPWRYVGPTWLIVGLVVVWTSVSLLVWSAAPAPCAQASHLCTGAFAGLPLSPTVGDFVYFTINAAIANVLPDITAQSPAAHLVFTGTMLSGLIVLARYAKALWADIRAEFVEKSP